MCASKCIVSALADDSIREKAQIYKKEPLKEFEKQINKAAGDICIANPGMLEKRGELLTCARQRVHDSGYVYRKGKSRSSVYGTEKEPAPKRVKPNKVFNG